MALTLWGTGFNNSGRSTNLAGNSNSWAGTIALNSVYDRQHDRPQQLGSPQMTPTFIGSAAGQLSLTGVISGAIATGQGRRRQRWRWAACCPIPFGGTTFVEQGTLLLDKAAGLNALGTSSTHLRRQRPSARSPGQLDAGRQQPDLQHDADRRQFYRHAESSTASPT